MNVLYLCNEYYGSKVHQNLCECLAQQGVSLQVYTYMTDPSKAGLNAFDSPHARFYYRPVIKRWHRFLYHLKIRKVYNDLMQTVDTQSIDLICATTMFTDGAVARKASQKLGVPYLVMARNTDVNTFLRYMPNTWIEGRRIAKGTAKVVCISTQIESHIRNAWQLRGTGLDHKCLIQPNGLDRYWIENKISITHHPSPITAPKAQYAQSPKPKAQSLLYVGVFNRNKNIVRLCRCVLQLSNRYPDICLGLVGGGGSKDRRVARFVERHPDHFRYHGRITDKAKLQEIYSQYTLFAMPSIHETFGLVYLEALSQNLPVIYTRGQGIDGLFPREIGEGVNAFSDKQIQEAIARIFDHPEAYHPCESVDFNNFQWPTIATRYKTLFTEILQEQ